MLLRMVVQRVQEEANHKQASFMVRYILSEVNPSDGLTRADLHARMMSCLNLLPFEVKEVTMDTRAFFEVVGSFGLLTDQFFQPEKKKFKAA